jgi:hypothetical protein
VKQFFKTISKNKKMEHNYYAFCLFSSADSFDDEQFSDVKDLLVAIANYNNRQPTQDFVNYLHNILPYKFVFYEYGKEGSHDVHFRDQSKRAGIIRVFTITN